MKIHWKYFSAKDDKFAIAFTISSQLSPISLDSSGFMGMLVN